MISRMHLRGSRASPRAFVRALGRAFALELPGDPAAYFRPSKESARIFSTGIYIVSISKNEPGTVSRSPLMYTDRKGLMIMFVYFVGFGFAREHKNFSK